MTWSSFGPGACPDWAEGFMLMFLLLNGGRRGILPRFVRKAFKGRADFVESPPSRHTFVYGITKEG